MLGDSITALIMFRSQLKSPSVMSRTIGQLSEAALSSVHNCRRFSKGNDANSPLSVSPLMVLQSEFRQSLIIYNPTFQRIPDAAYIRLITKRFSWLKIEPRHPGRNNSCNGIMMPSANSACTFSFTESRHVLNVRTDFCGILATVNNHVNRKANGLSVWNLSEIKR